MAFRTQVRILDKNTGEYKVYGNPFESNKGFKNRVYPTPPMPFESQGFVSKVVRPQNTMAKAFEEAKKVKEESVDIIDDSIKGIRDSDIAGEVEVSEEEQKDIISEEISEIEAQTPLTTYVEPVENLDEEDDVDYELNITDKQKAAVDRAYEEIIDEALKEVNDPDMLTNKEVNKCVRICCAHIIRNCKNINKKDIKEYIRYRIINDTSSERNIDNF